MNVEPYLARLNYTAALQPDHETLRGLQAAHMRAVPFENLDIVPLHRPIELDESALWDKIVVRKRGGFCYELNGLFAWLLKQAGFDVKYLNARVFTGAGKLGMDFDHLALLVSAPGKPTRWLADAGFGDSYLEPLVLEEGEQPQGLRAYRLEPSAGGYIAWQRDYDGTWERLYFFDLKPHDFPAEYESACLYHQKSPESSFTRRAIISRVIPDGRVSLEQDRLIITKNGARQELQVNPEEWPGMLWEYFGIWL
jgi:N-hydroxyarylamine O-acetyltransferase